MLVTMFSNADPESEAPLVAALAPHARVQLYPTGATTAASTTPAATSHELADGLRRFESALLAARPGAVLVRGANPSDLAAALAAAKLDLLIGRIDAGEELAGGGRPGEAPSPEAAYGRTIERLAGARFCSGEAQAAALREAGLGDHTFVVGPEPEGLVSAIVAWLGEL